MRRWQLMGLAAAAALACSCSAPRSIAPVDRMAIGQAEEAVERAKESDAAEHSPLELGKATEKLAGAKEAERNGRYERATLLAQQAEVDARLAEVRAQAAEARATSEETRRNIDALSSEAATPAPAAVHIEVEAGH